MSEQMRFSEAIRLGAMATTQGRGVDSIRDPHAPCAIGAALLAIGRQPRTLGDDSFSVAWREWPWTRQPLRCPVTGCVHEIGTSVIWGLNDWHRWTREQIADWVESIEHAQTTQAGKRDDASMEPALAVKSEAL